MQNVRIFSVLNQVSKFLTFPIITPSLFLPQERSFSQTAGQSLSLLCVYFYHPYERGSDQTSGQSVSLSCVIFFFALHTRGAQVRRQASLSLSTMFSFPVRRGTQVRRQDNLLQLAFFVAKTGEWGLKQKKFRIFSVDFRENPHQESLLNLMQLEPH